MSPSINRIIHVVFLTLSLTGCAGKFPQSPDLYSSQCKPVSSGNAPTIKGPEDVALGQIHSQAIAYISVNPRDSQCGEEGVGYLPGHIYSADLEIEEPQAQMMTVRLSNNRSQVRDLSGSFYPHGISLQKRHNQPDRLFVINHPVPGKVSKKEQCSCEGLCRNKRQSSEVMIFSVGSQNTLILEKIIPGKVLNDPDPDLDLNDLVALDGDKFLATENSGYKKSFGSLALLFGFNRGRVVYFDGNKFIQLSKLSNLGFANGIAVSKDKKYIYVTEFNGKRLNGYHLKNSWEDETPDLEMIDNVDLGIGLDNIEWESEARTHLLIGGQSSIMHSVSHLFSKGGTYSPSDVFRVPVDLATGKFQKEKIERVLDGKSARISGASVGAIYKHGTRMLVGTIFKDLYSCQITHSGSR